MPAPLIDLTAPAHTGVTAVFLTIRPMPARLLPARVRRLPGRVLCCLDPWTTRQEFTAWALDNLTVAERNLYRDAYGLPPDGHDTADWISEDVPSLLFVPAALRLAGEPAIQGGADALRERLDEDGLTLELAWLQAEMGDGLIPAQIAAVNG